MTELKKGSKAPNFELPTDGDGTITLAELLGKKIVLYFYPKDDTPGCTVEAKDFRDLEPDFKKAGAVIIGLSKDPVKSHDNFKKKYRLTFPLASDIESKIVAAYGSWVEKSMYGRKYMGIQRDTFLIDGQGKIAQIWRKVDVNGHAAEVLEAVRKLK